MATGYTSALPGSSAFAPGSTSFSMLCLPGG